MPLGFERLNERQTRPNMLINFLKPLDGPDKVVAEDFLSRIAAQCYPVMKKHHISVMALEEYEPNPEFLGRNFNAGEIIQLVLKDKRGKWLSMKFVQMVMMHELAHCKQMNHSRFFWVVRNDYAQQMDGLWREGYLGEGMWGRGRGLSDGNFINATTPDHSQIPETLCGGSYRRRGRKRRRGRHGEQQSDQLSYADRQQRRIARKFGIHGEGESVGEDDLMRGALETMNGGKRGQGKPKVANSKRGRELRAAAALARFNQASSKLSEQTSERLGELDSETDSEWEDDGYVPLNHSQGSAIIKDERGYDLVKVDSDREDDEGGASREMDELRTLSTAPERRQSQQTRQKNAHVQHNPDHSDADGEPGVIQQKDKPAYHPVENIAANPCNRHNAKIRNKTEAETRVTAEAAKDVTGEQRTTQRHLLHERIDRDAASRQENAATDPVPAQISSSTVKETLQPTVTTSTLSCPVCSLENELNAPICIACSNVLQPRLIPDHWSCRSEACKDSVHRNAGDAGRCGVCGAPKDSVSMGTVGNVKRPTGITKPEVLRWD